MLHMIKTLGIILFPVLLLAANNLALVLADSDVSVSIRAPVEIETNSSFTVTIDISEVTDLNTVQYNIWFNPSFFPRISNVQSSGMKFSGPF